MIDELTTLAARTAQLLERSVGLAAGGAKPGFLLRRLTAEMERHGAAHVRELLERAEQGDPQAVLAVRNLATVNYSCFWREAAHWPILAEHLRLRFLAGQPVRLWSAACASGEEAYSMAMVAADVARTLVGVTPDWRILASDIDTGALAAAQLGQYADPALGELPAAQRTRYLTPLPGGRGHHWQVAPALRAHIDFLRFDLAQRHWTLPHGAPFDVIILSNVLIYFDKPVQAQILENIAAGLRPDGILLTSRSEGQLGVAAAWFKACGDCAYILAATAPRSRQENRHAFPERPQ